MHFIYSICVKLLTCFRFGKYVLGDHDNTERMFVLEWNYCYLVMLCISDEQENLPGVFVKKSTCFIKYSGHGNKPIFNVM
jgi:hypothetical protein